MVITPGTAPIAECFTEAAPVTAHAVFEKIREVSVSEKDKGDRFENLCLRYLQVEPTFKNRFAKVYLWKDWPGNNGQVDIGIDLVAVEHNGDEWAIQAKCYSPSTTLQKSHIDSFFTESGRYNFKHRLIISTTDSWSKHAEASLENQSIPTQRHTLSDMVTAAVDWSEFMATGEGNLRAVGKKSLRPHQRQAIERVLTGWETSDRGKMVMACGTGKTFTAHGIANRVADANGGSARVLFLVPSLSLLQQTLRDWTAESGDGIKSFAVCSDSRIGESKRGDEITDIAPNDLVIPATTTAQALVDGMREVDGFEGLTVVFATYQSAQVVHDAQHLGLGDFDVVFCDEAHRTTGHTVPGAPADESNFVRVHDATYLASKRRLYMTATPKVFSDASKDKAAENSVVLCSMDDETLFGPLFHYLGFGQAVAEGLLADYKVLVLAVDEAEASVAFQQQIADEDNSLNLDDAVKIIGCWNGLSKRRHHDQTDDAFAVDPNPMRRAVAFSRNIAQSERMADKFHEVITSHIENNLVGDDDPLGCEVRHIDGTFSAPDRQTRLNWLSEPVPHEENVCRVLSNAKLLTEGVDVPNLDAVLFLDPRKSQVDVIQAVGRVMRLAPGKKYGYIILPVGIPAGLDPATALNDNRKYKVIWDVLQALRAHDDRFDASINQIELNDRMPENIIVRKIDLLGPSAVGDETTPVDEVEQPKKASEADVAKFVQEALFDSRDLQQAVYAKIVAKCGTRAYWEDWAKDVAQIAQRHILRINTILDHPTAEQAKAWETFMDGVHANLNPSITREQAVEMLAQHIITKPVFDALFSDFTFSERNVVSQVMEGMAQVLHDQAISKEAEDLESFYASVRRRVAGIDNAAGKQTVIKELYEKFFKAAFTKMSQSLGIVYTPVEVVDFIIHSVEAALLEHFDAGLNSHYVHILDPFTGTGTFPVRLLQSGIIAEKNLDWFYENRLHANELVLLAYYVAAVNIEATYHDLRKDRDYTPFPGIVLTDTYNLTESGAGNEVGTHQRQSHVEFENPWVKNGERGQRQNQRAVKVVFGNPPYSAGQDSANDNNQNTKYEELDLRLADTYVARSTATLKTSLYDSYIRAFRWASDRISDEGIVAFVSNGAWIDGQAADGMRKSIMDEFSAVYIYNLRGNQRTSGELSRREGGKIFGEGARTPIAIAILVKDPKHTGECVLHYHDIGDYLTREQKLAAIAEAESIAGLDWMQIVPDKHGDWLNQRDDSFGQFDLIGNKDSKASAENAIFDIYSAGIKTQRDAWAYNADSNEVAANMTRMIATYNAHVEALEELCASNPTEKPVQLMKGILDLNPSRIKWSDALFADLARTKRHRFASERVMVGQYRPFFKEYVYFDRGMNDRPGLQMRLFPTAEHENRAFVVSCAGHKKDFSTLAVNTVPNLDLVEKGQVFPMYAWEPTTVAFDDGGFDLSFGSAIKEDEVVIDGYKRRHAVTDWALRTYQNHYDDPSITKDDLFYYVFGVLNHPGYAAKYQDTLRKVLPRIPRLPDFRGFAQAGRDLFDLHLSYETVDPYPLVVEVTGDAEDPATWQVTKMNRPKKDRSRLVYNRQVTLSGIPDGADDYSVNGRSPLDWAIDQYQIRTDPDSGIVNDPNAFRRDNPRYIADMVGRTVAVSLRAQAIISRMPDFTVD